MFSVISSRLILSMYSVKSFSCRSTDGNGWCRIEVRVKQIVGNGNKSVLTGISISFLFRFGKFYTVSILIQFPHIIQFQFQLTESLFFR